MRGLFSFLEAILSLSVMFLLFMSVQQNLSLDTGQLVLLRKARLSYDISVGLLGSSEVCLLEEPNVEVPGYAIAYSVGGKVVGAVGSSPYRQKILVLCGEELVPVDVIVSEVG